MTTLFFGYVSSELDLCGTDPDLWNLNVCFETLPVFFLATVHPLLCDSTQSMKTQQC